MSEPSALLATAAWEPVRSPDPASRPLGTAWLPEAGVGVELESAGYVEEEWLLAGRADELRYDEAGRARPVIEAQPFATRVLVRRPADPARFSGAVQLEPNHPDADRSLSWGALAPWIVRNGHAHVGVTQHAPVLDELRRFDGDRYGSLSIPGSGLRFDVLGEVAALLADGRAGGPLAGFPVRRITVSGWSMTGTFWRTYLGEAFDDRWRRGDGSPAIDAYVICISSGGAARAGYALLGDGATPLPAADPRRRIGPHGVPVVELLSEAESETHRSVLREDSDGADAYRLYQVAGTSHVATGYPGLLTNGEQLARSGFPASPREIVERPSRARLDVVARALFEHLDAWVTGTAPAPRADRFSFLPAGEAGVRGRFEEAEPLRRDADGNAAGGVRTPWADLPLGAYLPHSTPAPGSCVPSPSAPYTDPALLADLIGHLEPFAPGELRARYGSPAAYAERYAARCAELVEAGWLLAEDVSQLVASLDEDRDLWT